LDEVLEQRRLGRLDVLVGHAARPPASLAGGGVGAGATASLCAAGSATGGGGAGSSGTGGPIVTGGSAATDGSVLGDAAGSPAAGGVADVVVAGVSANALSVSLLTPEIG